MDSRIDVCVFPVGYAVAGTVLDRAGSIFGRLQLSIDGADNERMGLVAERFVGFKLKDCADGIDATDRMWVVIAGCHWRRIDPDGHPRG